MKIPFIKMNGLGNDFVILEDLSKNIPINKSLIKKMSSRQYGIGCDQLLIIKEFSGDEALVDIYNSDGSLVGACGNGVRCVASHLMEKKLFDRVFIRTTEDKLECWKEKENICVNMGKPKFKPNEIPLLENVKETQFQIEGHKINCVSFGNPHGVIFFENLKELEKINVLDVGPRLEKNQIFLEGANIEFATILDDHSIRMKVWERGAGMTLACGSGACATLVIAVKLKLSERKNKLVLDGGDLFINWKEDNDVIMTGKVEKVYEGSFYVT
tara:strand:- start:1103 stop:1915 length:813 start_codon:yes stop_codon:yes gene_type:complete